MESCLADTARMCVTVSTDSVVQCPSDESWSEDKLSASGIHFEEDLFDAFTATEDGSRFSVIAAFVNRQSRELRAHRRSVEQLLAHQIELIRSAERSLFARVESVDEMSSVRDSVDASVCQTCVRAPSMDDVRSASLVSHEEDSEDSEHGTAWRRASDNIKHHMNALESYDTRSTMLSRLRHRRQNFKKFSHVTMPRFMKRLSVGVARVHSRDFAAECCWRHDLVVRLVHSGAFAASISCLIGASAVFTGYSVDCQIRGALHVYDDGSAGMFQIPWWHDLVEGTLVILFAIELLLTFYADGPHLFLCGRYCLWNITDTFVVIASLLALMLPTFSFTFLKVLSLFKVGRALRVLKIVRHFRLFRKLRILLAAVVNCLVFMCWAIVVLSVVVFAFSTLMLMSVSAYVREASLEDPVVEQLRMHFNSLPMAMLTLWMSCSGGVDWWEIGKLFEMISWPWCALFILFQAVMVLAMLNIVTGFVVHDAIEAISADKELQDEELVLMMSELEVFFHEMDRFNDGKVLKKDFVRFMDGITGRDFMAKLDVKVADATMLFDILDIDEDEEIGIEEFVMGAMELKTHADFVNLTVLLQNNSRMIKNNLKLMKALLNSVLALGDGQERLRSSAPSMVCTPHHLSTS